MLLGCAEISKDLYLVANVIRVGKILHSESIKKGDKIVVSQSYRRPYGVGVLPLSDPSLLDNSVDADEKEFSFKVFYSCHIVISKLLKFLRIL